MKREKVVYRESYPLYDCSIDPNHPCWGGKQNGLGSCGKDVIYEVVERNGKFVILRSEYEFDTHSVYTDDHVYIQTAPRELSEYDTLEDAIKHIKEVRQYEEYTGEY